MGPLMVYERNVSLRAAQAIPLTGYITAGAKMENAPKKYLADLLLDPCLKATYFERHRLHSRPMPGPPDPDFEAFLNDPHTILLKYQGLFAYIIRFYISSGLFPPDAKEDMLQTVNLEILERVRTIRQHYNGSTLFRTYVAAIVRNICLAEARKGRESHPPHRSLVRGVDVEDPASTDRYSLQQGREIFRAIMLQLGDTGPKLLILMKLRYALPFTREDIVAWWPSCGNREMRMLLEAFGGDYGTMTEKEKYLRISPFCNAAEGRVSGPDALRKWVVWQMRKIHRLLKRAFPESSFDDQDLRALFEDYHSPFLLGE